VGEYTTNLDLNNPFFIEIDYELKIDISAFAILKIFKPSIPNAYIAVSLSNDNNQITPREKGVYSATVKIEPFLNSGLYSILAGIAISTDRYIDHIEEHNIISIKNTGKFPFPITNEGREDSIVLTPMRWEIKKV